MTKTIKDPIAETVGLLCLLWHYAVHHCHLFRRTKIMKPVSLSRPLHPETNLVFITPAIYTYSSINKPGGKF